jgi:hypothetical protein
MTSRLSCQNCQHSRDAAGAKTAARSMSVTAPFCDGKQALTAICFAARCQWQYVCAVLFCVLPCRALEKTVTDFKISQ